MTLQELFAGQEQADVVTLRGEQVATLLSLLPQWLVAEPALVSATALHGAKLSHALTIPGQYFAMAGSRVWTYESA